jgi:hypothetical protein
VESEVLNYFLPNAILSQIFSQFLTIDDISRFDVALCNRRRRPFFLKCIQSKSCIWIGSKQQDFNQDLVTRPKLGGMNATSWMKARSIKIRHLMASCTTPDMAIDIGSFGRCLHWLSIGCVNYLSRKREGHELISDASFLKITETCCLLQSLTLRFCMVTDITMSRIAEGCPDLKELDLICCNEITDLGIIYLTERCHNLRHFAFTECENISDVCIIRISETCPMLQSLSFKFGEVTDDGLSGIAKGCPNLQSLIIKGCVNISDVGIEMVAKGCPNLLKLRLKYCDCITDLGIIKIAENCPYLQCLHLIECNMTDISVLRIADECHNIQELILEQWDFNFDKITGTAIIKVAIGCHKLQVK